MKEADYVFCFGPKLGVPLYVWANLKDGAQVWGVGTKSFGESNGIVYVRRNSKSYLSTTVAMETGIRERNDEWSRQWGSNYINFVELATMDDGKVGVFTEDGKFISQDCRHLTKEGAQWYGKKIEWKQIVDIAKCLGIVVVSLSIPVIGSMEYGSLVMGNVPALSFVIAVIGSTMLLSVSKLLAQCKHKQFLAVGGGNSVSCSASSSYGCC